ncbi:hypothetical protein ACFYW9_03080 [Streptomyces sp. NPDC002698]|uniref:hypothetical protein n=1 Tax=Streptomyces sp. NPDC002698 TaxID=3364660 RepID=UPI0036A589F5
MYARTAVVGRTTVLTGFGSAVHRQGRAEPVDDDRASGTDTVITMGRVGKRADLMTEGPLRTGTVK